MAEVELYNETPFFGDLLPLLDLEGHEARLSILKATWEVGADGSLAPAEDLRPIRHGDVPWGEPDRADIRYPGDLAPGKPGTDVIVTGFARPPDGKRIPWMDVELSFADRAKRLRVFGPRRWEKGVLGVKPSAPGPLEPIPVSWGNAFGGFDPSDPERILEEPRNPVGRGLRRDAGTLEGEPVPCVEDPKDLISGASSRPTPAGCAPVGRNFAPRRGWAGTHDERWLREVCPGRPADYDPRFENCAPADQVFPTPWQGGEPLSVSGMSPRGVLRFAAPKLRVVMVATVGGAEREVRPHLDTVIVDTEACVVEAVWRSLFPLGSPAKGLLEKVKIQAKGFV